MAGYGWDEYDARNGGQQTIHDAGNKIDITTSFVKIPGGTNGGSWGVRVTGTPREDAPARLMTTMIFYATLEGLGNLEVENDRDELGYEDDVTLKGRSAGLGDYKLVITKGKGEHPPETHESYKDKPLDRTIVHSFTVPEEALWQIKPVMYKHLKDEIDGYVAKYTTEAMPPPWQVYTISNDPGIGNMHMVQKVFEGAFEFDVIFSSGSAPKEITSKDITKEINSISVSFGERFGDIFNLKAPYNSPKYSKFAKSMFSNLFGGIGYFYGNEVVDRSYASEYDEENEGFWEEAAEARGRHQEKLEGPFELYTSIPSRPFFPRGFLWDEGFHLLPIADWDMDIALEIVKSWFNLMDSDGWIAREQILGDEARSKVPAEFQVQYPHYANPPTLFFILDAFVERLAKANGSAMPTKESLNPDGSSLQNAHLENPEAANQYLQAIYPLLKRQYHWFRRTQSGDIATYDREAYSSKEAYRWRGRTVQHVLTSGLDDYPRPQPPHPGELHVDLISWVGVMAKSLKNIATYLDETDDAKEFARNENAILRNIDDLHWSEKEKTYCDASIDEFEENVLVCHKGYISIFPFLTGLLPPNSPKLGPILDLIEDPEQLWTSYGLRSLSKSDEYYGTAENYWRGPIWMNMNYLAVRELLVSVISFPPSSLLLSHPCFFSMHMSNNLRISLSPNPLTHPVHAGSTSPSAKIWSVTCISPGRKRGLRGSNIIQKMDMGNGHSILLGGRA
jgi:mannosyl-oligosaccharide glucosidase